MDNKTFTEILSADLGLPKEEVENLTSALAGLIGEKVAQLDTVSLPCFGAFEPKKRQERIVVHPATGNRLLVPPKIVISFRPATALKQKIRHGE